MKVTSVTRTNCKTGSGYYSKALKCPGCKKTVKLGERVFTHSGNGKFAVHMDCLAEALAAEPEFHDYEADFDKLSKEYLNSAT